MKYTAKLIGGPHDGRIVEILGQCYTVKVRRSLHHQWWFDAIYEWEEEDDGFFVGRFKGYFRNGQRVDRLGRRYRLQVGKGK